MRYLFIGVLLLAGCTTGEGDGAAAILASDIERDIRELSSDAYMGRAPGTEGDIKTQAYLIRELRNLGVEPGTADGTWQQPFTLVALQARQPESWVMRSGEGFEVFDLGRDFIVAAGAQADQVGVEDAELVFVGYGIQAPEYHWDDYKGMDMRGKVLVMLNNDPHADEDLFQGDTRLYYGRWTYKYEIAAEMGAAGVIIIHTDYSAGYPWQVVQTSWSGPQFELPNEGEPTVQLEAWMTEDATRRLLALTGHHLDQLTAAAQSREFEPVPLGLTTSLTMNVSRSETGSANVLGLLHGTDKADEVVIYTAHHDHLGIAEGVGRGDGDVIYNGAMDNASGMSSVLAIARAFKAGPPPRRSILFAFVGAEEQGLLGSRYYARHPTFPPGKIAANVNMDGGQVAGRTRDISYIGYGRSSIDTVAEETAATQDRTVIGDTFPSAGYFYRSDHFSLARIGVPSLYFRGGQDLLEGGLEKGRIISQAYIAQHYHQPSDEVTAMWRFDGLEEDARFGYLAGLRLANDDEIPAWYPGDEFEAARLDALAN